MAEQDESLRERVTRAIAESDGVDLGALYDSALWADYGKNADAAIAAMRGPVVETGQADEVARRLGEALWAHNPRGRHYCSCCWQGDDVGVHIQDCLLPVVNDLIAQAMQPVLDLADRHDRCCGFVTVAQLRAVVEGAVER